MTPDTSRTALDTMLDTVEWTEIRHAHIVGVGDLDALYATHEGTITFAGLELRCYILNDGQRVFDADALAEEFAHAAGHKRSTE